MKQFIHHLRVLCAVLCWVVAAQSAVASGGPRSEYYDSVEVSLLTCAPHEEIYSLYGHSALRFRDLHNGQDVVLNWGTFDFKAPHFVMRFVFGLTDYELGLSNYSDFCRYYRHWGSMVTEQVLNLTADEKVALQQLVGNNLLEENRVYRYNFFYDNCSTRPRDVVERSVEGKIMYDQRPDYTPTFRDMLREKTSHHPWATFGNDMLLGLLADRPTTLRQQEFLPDHLLYDFDHAQVLAPDGTSRPLVRERRLAVKPGVQLVEPDFPLTPIECGIALLVVTLLVSVGEWNRAHAAYGPCRLRAFRHALLPASRHHAQPAAAAGQSSSPVLPARHPPSASHPLLDVTAGHGLPVPHRRSFPALRRGYGVFGIMFAGALVDSSSLR